MQAYREGDRVRLGNIHGILITFFDDNVLLYTDHEVGWAPEHIVSAGLSQRLCNVLMLCLRRQFGSNLSELPVYKQKRFLCAKLDKIRHLRLSPVPKAILDPRYRRRRTYLSLASHYLRMNDEVGFDRACGEIEELQESIENSPCWQA